MSIAALKDARGGQLAWTPYIKQFPHAKQLAFLSLSDIREVFFGGAAGPGKSSALLMGALQYVDVPGYSAIIFRRKFTDLWLSGGLVPRSIEWLADTDARWDNANNRHTWRFPAGSTLSFGYLDSKDDKYRYKSSEYQYIAFDELTGFLEEDYTYLFRSLRRLRGSDVPIRMRSASNPGDRGHAWVRRRFDIRYNQAEGIYLGHHPTRLYIPALFSDNVHIDAAEYERSLSNLSEIERAYQLSGDWGALGGKLFKAEWAQHYWRDGRYVILDPNGVGPPLDITEARECKIIQMVDTASTSQDMVGTSKRSPSWTAIGTFGVTPGNDLIVLEFQRFQAEVPEVLSRIQQSYNQWQPLFVGIEQAHAGVAVVQLLQRAGVTVFGLKPHTTDKVTRSNDITAQMFNGKVWFPSKHCSWMEDLESELYGWTGSKDEPDDQIDVLSYAGMYVAGKLPLMQRGAAPRVIRHTRAGIPGGW